MVCVCVYVSKKFDHVVLLQTIFDIGLSHRHNPFCVFLGSEL